MVSCWVWARAIVLIAPASRKKQIATTIKVTRDMRLTSRYLMIMPAVSGAYQIVL